ncbi:F-box only protein 34 [Scomber scombrus]|uniref:F-box only protein 34 n=1 Tax=Scomber scombrus TaxID=13677 RepID=A0AAV1QLH0_SCOSC
MSERCDAEQMSLKPRPAAANQLTVWRTIMHLKPKLVRSERSAVFLSQQGALLRTGSGNHGNRLPLSVISTNTLRRGNGVTHGNSSVVTSLRLKTSGGSLQLVSSPPSSCENDSLRLFHEDADAPLDIWAAIKPGHVREKIAIFASETGRSDAAGGSERTSSCGSGAVSTPQRPGKAKGSWEETSNAKRRRRSNQNLQQDLRIQILESPEHAQKPSPQGGGEETGEEGGEEGDRKLSVGDMVAFLELRAKQPENKPSLQRSSASITLSRAPPPEVREGSEVREEPEIVRVSDMVAKLEGLSHRDGLRRTVGRVLLAAGDQSPAPCTPAALTSPLTTSSLWAAQPISCSETPRTESSALTPPPPALAPPSSADVVDTPPKKEGAEPLPGLLFLSPQPRPPTNAKPRPSHLTMTFDLDAAPPLSPPVSERQQRGVEDAVAAVTASRQGFLQVRQRVQQLLEPQPYLSLLPHHLLLKVLQLLDTQSLAALKCSCRYLLFIIDTYGVRPADSLWVSDPRYRDDPCKQCKKRYGRGDVSLCRWHHKPFCQALPYGPGYWMCCRGTRRDAPGCNVGLHDNRWVPAFHSINVPIYRAEGD